MSKENNEPRPLTAIEQSLASCSPTPARIDRDRLMFLAGQANALAGELHQGSMKHETSAQDARKRLTLPVRQSWLWPASTASFAATSLALALALVFRADSQPPTIVYRDRPISTSDTPVPQQTTSPPATQSLAAASPHDREQQDISGAYLKTREVALRMGLDALGSTPYSTAPAGTSSYRDLWVGLTAASGSQSDKPEKQSSM